MQCRFKLRGVKFKRYLRWDELPEEVVAIDTIATFKRYLDRGLDGKGEEEY